MITSNSCSWTLVSIFFHEHGLLGTLELLIKFFLHLFIFELFLSLEFSLVKSFYFDSGEACGFIFMLFLSGINVLGRKWFSFVKVKSKFVFFIWIILQDDSGWYKSWLICWILLCKVKSIDIILLKLLKNICLFILLRKSNVRKFFLCHEMSLVDLFFKCMTVVSHS